MKPVLTVAAGLLAAAATAPIAVAQGSFTAAPSGGADSAAAGALAGDAGAGVLTVDPVAETRESEPGAPGTDVLADPPNLSVGSDGAADAGVIAGSSDMPVDAGDVRNGTDTPLGADLREPEGVLDTVPNVAPLGGGGVEATAPAVVEADRPLVILPAEDGQRDESLDDESAPALSEGVGGDVDPEMIDAGDGMDSMSR